LSECAHGSSHKSITFVNGGHGAFCLWPFSFLAPSVATATEMISVAVLIGERFCNHLDQQAMRERSLPMKIRDQFEQQLQNLRVETMALGRQAVEQVRHALQAFESHDVGLAQQVRKADKQLNQKRFAIEEMCVTVLATQQPTAGDLRRVVAVMNSIVDLERVGDHAKSLAKIVIFLQDHPDVTTPPLLQQMSKQAVKQIQDAIYAYINDDVEQAKKILRDDDALDQLYAQFYTQMMQEGFQRPEQAEVSYQLLRAGRALERVGDMATNMAEHVIYIVTGTLYEKDSDPGDLVDKVLGERSNATND
jgi:phosphate transport system protein